MAGDVKDLVTLETAFTGADSAFIVVNFWDNDIMMKEEELTKRILDVAKKRRSSKSFTQVSPMWSRSVGAS